MTTPTCERCGTKFPGREVCKHCGVPIGLADGDLVRFRVGQLMEKDGISEKAAKRQLNKNKKARNKPGRVGVKR